MKKIFIITILLCIMLLTGCGKDSPDNAFKNLTNKINKLNSYMISGTMEVKNNNNTYNYEVTVSYMNKDKYRVSLINTSNDHEQVILRNDDGVFVLTPSLNKSFKFQSDWPYNNSQVYILSSIITDLNNDSKVVKEEKDNKYIFTSKVNYPNNNKLIKQRVTVNKDLFVESIEVLNDENIAEMIFKINKTDYNPTFDETYFEVNNIINSQKNNDSNQNNEDKKENNNLETKEDTNDDYNNDKKSCDPKVDSNCETNNTKTLPNNDTNNAKSSQNAYKTTMTMNGDESDKTASLQDIIYPLYLPSGTVLKNQEKVSKTNGERVILTFAGDKEFTLVEETAVKEKEFTIIPTYGEPGFVNDSIGAISDNSLNWISNGIEYYMVSDVMNVIELLDVANSIDVQAVAALK